MTITPRLICALIIYMLMLGANLRAQSAWLPPTDRSSVSFETYYIHHPGTSQSGPAVFVTSSLRIRPDLTFELETPFAHSDPQTAIGDPYIGISYRGNNSSALTLDVGIRLPLASDDKNRARIVGIHTDFDRWEAFSPDQYSLRALFGRYWSKTSSPHVGWIKGGGTLLVSHKSKDHELLADFQAGIWHLGDRNVFGFNLIGRSLLTQSDLSLSQRSEVLFAFGFAVDLGNFWPALHWRVPVYDRGLFDLGHRASSVIGVSMTILFGENIKVKRPNPNPGGWF